MTLLFQRREKCIQISNRRILLRHRPLPGSIIPGKPITKNQPSFFCNPYTPCIVIRHVSRMSVKNVPKEAFKRRRLFMIMLTLGIHYTQHVQNPVERHSKRQNLCFCPIDDSGNTACVRIDHDIHLTQVAVLARINGYVGAKDFIELFAYLGNDAGKPCRKLLG